MVITVQACALHQLLEDGECISTLSGHRDEVVSLAVVASSAQCGVVASGAEDGTLKLWGVLRV